MNLYETIFILDAAPDAIDTEIKKVTDLIAAQNGEVILVDRWGARKLAYEIKHKTQGFYTCIYFRGEEKLPGVLENQYKLNERCLRYLTVLSIHTAEEMAAKVDKASADKVSAEKAAAEKVSTEKAAAEKASTEKAAAEKAAAAAVAPAVAAPDHPAAAVESPEQVEAAASQPEAEGTTGAEEDAPEADSAAETPPEETAEETATEKEEQPKRAPAEGNSENAAGDADEAVATEEKDQDAETGS